MLKILTPALIILFTCACSFTPTQIPTADFDYEQANQIDIELILKKYHQIQSGLDVNQWTTQFNYPLTLLLGEGINLVVEEKNSAEFFIPIIAYLDNQQLQHSQWHKLTIRSLDQNLAIASTTVSQIDTQGNIIDQFSELYTLSKKGGVWKISSISRFSLEQYVSL
ncbi:MAG: hypothetical protein COB51_01235 [Moraxellaceae bacterium]|nr:MAG: hypothetical protein COB51_01235 [Moraxellaceae bacterium]